MLTGFFVALGSHCPVWLRCGAKAAPFLPHVDGCCQEPGPGGGEQYTPALLLILLLATGRVGTWWGDQGGLQFGMLAVPGSPQQQEWIQHLLLAAKGQHC